MRMAACPSRPEGGSESADQDLGEPDAARLVLLRESRPFRAVDVEDAEQLAVADQWKHNLAVRRAVAGDVAGEGVNILDPLDLPALGRSAAHALVEGHADAGRAALERPQNQLAADVAVEADPVHVRKGLEDQSRSVGH